MQNDQSVGKLSEVTPAQLRSRKRRRTRIKEKQQELLFHEKLQIHHPNVNLELHPTLPIRIESIDSTCSKYARKKYSIPPNPRLFIKITSYQWENIYPPQIPPKRETKKKKIGNHSSVPLLETNKPPSPLPERNRKSHLNAAVTKESETFQLERLLAARSSSDFPHTHPNTRNCTRGRAPISDCHSNNHPAPVR